MNVRPWWTRNVQSRRGFVTLILFALLGSCESDDAQTKLKPTDPLYAPTGAGIRDHMVLLASDALQGREAGTPGHQAAAEYVASQFEEIGQNRSATTARIIKMSPFSKLAS